jgi:hypothetical protein
MLHYPRVILHAVGIQIKLIFNRGCSGQHHPMSAVAAFPLQFLYNARKYTVYCYSVNIPFHSSSKFMDFVKMRKDLKCFVISSRLLAGQFSHCWTFFLSSSLLVWSNVQWWIRWSTVWSSSLQGRVALSIRLKSVEIRPGSSMPSYHGHEIRVFAYIHFQPVSYVWEELFTRGCFCAIIPIRLPFLCNYLI